MGGNVTFFAYFRNGKRVRRRIRAAAPWSHRITSLVP